MVIWSYGNGCSRASDTSRLGVGEVARFRLEMENEIVQINKVKDGKN
ncbi:hypothetical protein CAter282_1697 [Collimonas arenae]|uniref:Uncharacterized protein n=1 Tax=Collimonas arenae TaxID=279058 RepID=A0A127PP53_9BURK|nr:hypothetical protein CAter10_1830 [Collimonas arenae]AMP09478.1 hypothetical protein CAter282_1697 [Collimonas arenae]